MNALFSLDDEYTLQATINEAAVKAAIDFVQEHATLLSGRQSLAEIISAVNAIKILFLIAKTTIIFLPI